MLVDIIYDDKDLFWNDDYKKLLTEDTVELIADKHSRQPENQPYIKADLMKDP